MKISIWNRSSRNNGRICWMTVWGTVIGFFVTAIVKGGSSYNGIYPSTIGCIAFLFLFMWFEECCFARERDEYLGWEQ